METSLQIQKPVERARQAQSNRYQSQITNAKVPFEILIETSPLTEAQQNILTKLALKQKWSNRVQIKVIRLVRTISDLAGKKTLPMPLFGKL